MMDFFLVPVIHYHPSITKCCSTQMRICGYPRILLSVIEETEMLLNRPKMRYLRPDITLIYGNCRAAFSALIRLIVSILLHGVALCQHHFSRVVCHGPANILNQASVLHALGLMLIRIKLNVLHVATIGRFGYALSVGISDVDDTQTSMQRIIFK
mmetsp:Transcript_4609/g.11877  ORF Transcript_4609/g.11877 Transcript_4609/m.11877 type:complete len:155 (+) Transcript_4609:933-1397(+)